MDELLAIVARIEDAPPVVSGILASYKVPWGKTYRQWDTKGRLWIWMSRAELYDTLAMRTRKAESPMELLMGISIYHV